MGNFKAIIKNAKKFNCDIKLANELILSINQTTRRDGKTGKSTDIFGKYWFSTPKGEVLFKLIGKEADFDTGNMQKLNEIICYRLAKQMGVNCAEYVPAKVDGKIKGLASVNFLNKGEKLISLYDLVSCGNNILSIMQNLEQLKDYYNTINLRQIFYSLYAYSIFDLLTCQEDRHKNNISFIVDKRNNLKIAPIYDNEYSFFVSAFLFFGDEVYNSAEEFIDNYFISAGLMTPNYTKKEDDGLRGFDLISKQLVMIAKRDKTCEQILKNILNNANLVPVYEELESEGYIIDSKYKDFTISILDVTRKRVKNIFKNLTSESQNEK